MAIEIVDSEIEALAGRLAEKLKVTPEVAVKIAVENQLARDIETSAKQNPELQK